MYIMDFFQCYPKMKNIVYLFGNRNKLSGQLENTS